jgi:hypothetical protein
MKDHSDKVTVFALACKNVMQKGVMWQVSLEIDVFQQVIIAT